MLNPHYVEGMVDTIIDYTHALQRSLSQHNDAKSGDDCREIVNEMIGFAHIMQYRISEVENASAKEMEKSWCEDRILYLAIDNTKGGFAV